MKRALGSILRIFAGLAAFGAALLAVVAAALFASGALTGERVKEAVRVLREGPAAPAPPPSDEAAQREAAHRAAEETLARRREELRRQEARLAARALQLEADRARLEEDRRRLAEAQAAARTEPGAPEEISPASVALLSRMDGPEAAEVMKDWDDARILAALRALRPSKAAEVLAAFRTDPRLEASFRRPPAGAPKDARTRLDRLFEGLKE